MTEIIISRLEKRIKKVETKVSEIKDNYEEMDNNLEDIYDTINDLNTNDSRQINKNNSRDNKNDSRDNKNITKYIDSIINKNNYSPTELINIKNECIIFYSKLIQNQPQLKDEHDSGSIKEHITYFIEQPEPQRKLILDNLEKVFELTNTKTPRLFKILNSTLDTYHKKIALNKLHILETMQKSDSEYFKISQWLDTFLEIPFNIYKTPSYMDSQITTNPAKYLTDSRTHLDTVIYGQEQTKQHIVEILARMIRNPKTLGSVFAIYGEAGTGKTTLIKDGLSHIFGLPFIFISLGGAQDRATLAGSNYVYEGSSCGKIIQSLKQSQCMNPIFYFDELDKTSGTEKGNEIINLLIHLTDYTQNCHFMDDYMDGIAIDLSRATFIFSFNDKNKVSPILLDRMEIIKFKSYSNSEKMVIARDFLLPNVIKNVFNDSNIKIVISDENMSNIINFGYGYGGPSNGCEGPSNGGPSPKDPLVPAGSFVKKRFKNKYLKLGKIMKNVSRRKKENKYSGNGKCNGGVRYIKKILERIVSRLNLQLFQKAAFRKSRTKTLERLKPLSKEFKKSRAQSTDTDNIVVDEKIINEILNNK